jgi:modulator of FtsH protease HflK
MPNDDFKVHEIRPNKNRNQNPLNDILEDLKEKFGGGGGGNGSNGSGNGGGPSGQGTPPNGGGALVTIGIVLFLVWGGMSSFYTIDVSEEGVVTYFGKYDRTTGSGFHFKMPFGVEKVIKVQSKRILQEEFGFRTANTSRRVTTYDKDAYGHESHMLTGDLNVADVEWVVQYRISDPWKFLFKARDVTRTIRDVSMSIMRRVIGDRLVNDVLTTGRVEIRNEAKILTQKLLDTYDMGIHIESILLQDVNPPKEVKPSFNEVNAAKQEQEKIINLAERDYNKVIPEARGKAEQKISDAEAYSIDLVNRAKGDANRFKQVLVEYRKDPAITRSRMYLDTMEEIFTKVEKFTIVDSKVKGVLPLYGKLGK